MNLLFIDDEPDWLEDMSDLALSLPEVKLAWTLDHPGEIADFLQVHHPDIIGIDLQMLPIDGLQVAQMLSWRNPLPLLLISAHLEAYPLTDLMATGVRGMLSKGQLSRQLRPALQALKAGQTWFPQYAVRQQQAHEAQKRDSLNHHWAQLTPRQKDICLLFSQGKAAKEIAACLQIGIETVKSHLRQARQIFGASQGYDLQAQLHQLQMAQHPAQLKSIKKRLGQQNAYRPTGYDR